MAAILGGVDVVVIAAVFLVVVLVGIVIVRPILVGIFAQAPFIGGWLSSNVDGLLAGWQRGIAATAANSITALADVIDWLQATWGDLSSTVVGFAQLTYTAFWKLQNLVIPAVEAQVTAAWSAGVADAEAQATAALNAVQAADTAAIASVEAEAQSLAAGVLSEAQALTAQVTALAQGLFSTAEADAVALVQQERAFVVGQVLGVDAQIQAVAADAATALGNAEAALTADIGQVAGSLGGQLTADVNQLIAQINADKAALTAALAGTAAGLAADIAAIKALDCLKFCSPLADVGSFLNGLDAFLLIGAVAYARANPQDAINFLNGEVLPFVTSAASDVEGLIGG